MPPKRVPPEPLPAHAILHDQVCVYVQGMPAKASRQQPRPTLFPGVPPDPPTGQGVFSPEQATMVEPHVVLDRPCVILDPETTSRPPTFDRVNLPGFREFVAVLS